MRKTGLLLLLALASCGAEKVLTDKQYFEAANKAMESEAYDLAGDQYQKLMEEYPFSEYTEEAQLKSAYAQHMSKKYVEAIASFQDFERMHPTNPNLPFAEFYLAMAYMEQMGKRDRDQKAADNAHAHFRSLIDRYPDSPYATKAREKLQECREMLADHERSVASFYLTWDNPLGAEARLRYLLDTYPDTEVAAQGLLEFGKYFRRRGDLNRAALAFATMVEQYPQSPKLEDAKAALARLTAKKVRVAEEPLRALLETLGRPSLQAGQPPAVASSPSAVPPGPAGAFDRPKTIR